MRYHCMLFLLPILFTACNPDSVPEYASFDEYPLYAPRNLGADYQSKATTFRLWSPPAQAARVRLYETGDGGTYYDEREMRRGESGQWEITVEGDLDGNFYTYQVKINGQWLEEAVDPYARAAGVNGKRGQIIDLSETDPAGWEDDVRPPLEHPTDIVLYELHVRDLSTHPSSGIKQRGKYLGLTELGTTSPLGDTTGLDHLVQLGVTHVHLLPVFDYLSVDESRLDSAQFNWGYDPQNYNVPEGSYSTDPYDGAVRIREFKQMVQALHRRGIRVVMDVVYNHTGRTENSNLNKLVPGYYYRQREDGSFSDASACGNEVASERPMVRKFIRESVSYWVEEYHIDGFRFDLMGIMDILTMNEISATVHAIDSSIFLYGEGWTAGASPLPDSLRALKANTPELERIAAFSDDVRDAMKGNVFEPEDRGFISGKPGLEESIKFGIVGATRHPQVVYDSVNYSKAPWADEPAQCITYASCHDNHTLWDRLLLSVPDATEAARIRMDKLAATIVLTSQGVPFLHAGSELLRSKDGEENSYQSPDAINQIDWRRKGQYQPVFEYYRQLIQLRKNHPAFRLRSTEAIQNALRFIELESPRELMVAYQLSDHAGGDSWKDILVILNGARQPQSIQLPEGNWLLAADGQRVDEQGIRAVTNGRLRVPASTAYVLFQKGLEI